MPNPTLREIVETFTEEELSLTVPIEFQDVSADDYPYVNEYNRLLASAQTNADTDEGYDAFVAANEYRTANQEHIDKYVLDAKKLNILMTLVINAYMFAKGEKSATNTSYDNSISKFISDNVQDAIDELYKTKLDLVGGTLTGDLLATTIIADKIYGAVWNDYAEWFEKENIFDNFEAGDICAWGNKGVVLAEENDACVVGIVSDSYGHILGGLPLDNMESNHKHFVPIGLSGRVKVKVKGTVNKGDLIVSAGYGIGKVNNESSARYIVGKALESSDNEEVKLITVLIL